MSSRCKVLCRRPPAVQEKSSHFLKRSVSCVLLSVSVLQQQPYKFAKWRLENHLGLPQRTRHFQLRLRRLSNFCSLKRPEDIKCKHSLKYTFYCIFLVIKKKWNYSFINIHKLEVHWGRIVLKAATWPFKRLELDDMALCHCHWWWVLLGPHYNASHRSTVVLRKQPNWRSERNSLVCASEKRAVVEGFFFSCGASVGLDFRSVHLKCSMEQCLTNEESDIV